MTKQKDKGINHKLYLARDSVVEYRSFENEMSFYDAVKNGDLETVEEEMQKFQKEALQGKGVLSDNIVRNLLYHFIISTAMVARFCIEGGMDHEMAYSLSDYYIQKADHCTTTESLKKLQYTMAVDYCKRMKQMKKINIYIWCNKNQISSLMKHYEDKGCNVDLLVWHKTNPIPTCKISSHIISSPSNKKDTKITKT